MVPAPRREEAEEALEEEVLRVVAMAAPWVVWELWDRLAEMVLRRGEKLERWAG